MKKIGLLLLVLSFIGSSMILTGCDSPVDTSAVDSTTPDPDPGDDDPAPVVNDNFEISVNATEWSSFMHQNAITIEGCRIAKDASPREYIDCLLEVPERSNHFNDIVLDINIPPQMCNYLRFSNYYYYNWKLGRGPSNIWIRNYEDAAGEPMAPFQECSEDGAAFVACNDPSLEFLLSNSSPVCEYNYNALDAANPNCCIGGYAVTTQRYDNVGFSIVDSTSVVGTWGSKYDQQCFGGTASRDASWPKNSVNRPGTLIYKTWESGFENGSYTLMSPISLISGQYNLFTSNYVGVATPQAILGYTDNGSVANGNDTSVPPTQDLYSFDCLDEGGEVIHSIDLRIREWDTRAEYDTFVSTGVGNSDSLVTDVEGTDCAYEDPSAGSCNDISDWDNLLSTDFPQSKW